MIDDPFTCFAFGYFAHFSGFLLNASVRQKTYDVLQYDDFSGGGPAVPLVFGFREKR